MKSNKKNEIKQKKMKSNKKKNSNKKMKSKKSFFYWYYQLDLPGTFGLVVKLVVRNSVLSLPL